MNSRKKGTAFEGDVARALEAAGFVVRGLESGGDHLAIAPDGRVFHVEAKRQERVQLPWWLKQQRRDCPPTALPVLVFRQNRDEAYVVQPLADWLGCVGHPQS